MFSREGAKNAERNELYFLLKSASSAGDKITAKYKDTNRITVNTYIHIMSKKQFLAGWNLSLNDSDECKRIMQTQVVTEADAVGIGTYIELTYDDNDVLAETVVYMDNEIEENEHINHNLLQHKPIGKFKYRELAPNVLYKLLEDANGVHHLGGEVPAGFTMPEAKLAVPFQYLGRLNNTDAFAWLPFPLHLVCPIYLNFDKLFLDYSNPQHPVLINREEMEDAGTSYDDDLNTESEIVFAEKRFHTAPSDWYGIAGVPKWIQYAEIPICPKNGKPMRFVCQLDGNGVKASRSNVTPHDEWYRRYYEELNFWGDGELYVFFEPESKTACYFIQNT